MAAQDLDRRHRQVLFAVIRQFVDDGKPVGSRAVARTHPERLSAATIRNLMADLEEMGLLRQPHTSAGRVPTDRAYRLYVDSLSSHHRLAPGDRRSLREAFQAIDGNVDEVLGQVSRFLSSVSNLIGVVLRFPLDSVEMRRMEFVGLGGRTALGLFVSTTGVVGQKLLHLDEDLSQEDLDRAGRLLTDSFAGMSLKKIREQLLARMAEEKALYDRLLARALALGRRCVEASDADGSRVFLDGAFHLVGQPEFADVDQMRALFRTFEEEGRVVKILNRCLEGDGVTVRIGSEQGDPEMVATSVVTSPYFCQDRAIGGVGVIGPTRMEYPRIIAVVDQIGRLLSQRLSGAVG